MSEKTKEKIKIRTHFAQIIVNPYGKPYYEILYFDPADKTYHVGFSSYNLDYVREWLEEEFEIDDTSPALEPERVAELAQAEKDGRLVVLPCKVGDLLYEVDLPKYGVITCKVLHVGTYNGPAAHVERNPMVSAVSVGVEVVEGHGKGSGYAFEAEDFGKTVFLTREEAEEALKKREEADNEAD